MMSSSSGSEGKNKKLISTIRKGDKRPIASDIYSSQMPVLVRVIKANGNPKRPNMIMIEEGMEDIIQRT